MNTVSKYRAFSASGNKKKSPHKKIKLQKDLDTSGDPKHLILSHQNDQGEIQQSIKQQMMRVVYPIQNILNTDYTLLDKTKNTKIFVCIYRLKIVESSQPRHYIEYLLYKYSGTSKKVPSELKNSLIFPFEVSNGRNTYLQIANKLFNAITDGIYAKPDPQGFLENGDDIYFFYQSAEKNPIEAVEYRTSEDQIWWALIDEICNHKKLITFPIRSHVYSLFYTNPTLIYLRDNNNKDIEIPTVGYIGAYYKTLPSVVLQISLSPNSDENNERVFGSFVYAVREGGWSADFKPLTIEGVEVANKNGRYTKGAIARFAVFLENTDVVGVTNRDLEMYIKTPNNWKKEYNSLFYGKLKGKIQSQNPHFKINTFAQQVPLTYHYLDMKTLKQWDPTSVSYRIE